MFRLNTLILIGFVAGFIGCGSRVENPFVPSMQEDAFRPASKPTVSGPLSGVRVSQESSPGAGDFDDHILGTIDVFSTTLTAEDYYGFDFSDYSYHGPAPSAVADRTQFFLVDASDGLSLFVLHDRTNATGGTADMRLELKNDTADFTAHDDPTANDQYIVSGGGTLFETDHQWHSGRTDGFAIGALDGEDWVMFGDFISFSGLTSWTAVSSDGSVVPLVLETGRRVRLDMPQGFIPIHLDIKPQSCPNSLNVNSGGTLPTAILGTEAFDVTGVDPASIRLEGVAPVKWSYEDVAEPYVSIAGKENCGDCTEAGADGFMDLTLKFKKQDVSAALSAVQDGEARVLKLTGKLTDGTEIQGEDVVCILKKRN